MGYLCMYLEKWFGDLVVVFERMCCDVVVVGVLFELWVV